jgi:hypothetical protein
MDDLERLLRWLDRHVTEQKKIGVQPIALIVVSAALILALTWILWK